MARTTFPARGAALLTAFALALGGCAGASSADDDGRARVRFALDWTPNTNHTGLYVALAQGWFDEAGLDVQVLPYSDTAPDQLVDAGAAEAGISTHDGSLLAQAAGADVVIVMAVLQHWATAIGVRADDERIRSPRDLDGLVYAGFGMPGEVPLLREVIRADGGTGDFTTVVLGSSAYEALYAGEADFTIPYVAWEGIEAERAGTPMRYLHYTDHGFPDAYQVVVDASRTWVADEPETARAFVATLRRGYAWAAEHPDEAAALLVEQNPDAFVDRDMVTRSQRMLAADWLRADDGSVGTMTLAQVAGYGDFLFDAGVLAGPDGDPPAQRPDWSTTFTTSLLGTP